ELRRTGCGLPVITEEVELVAELGERVHRRDNPPEHPIELPELEQRHARERTAPVGVLVVTDEAGVHDRYSPGDVDHARVGGELREGALGGHEMDAVFRPVL